MGIIKTIKMLEREEGMEEGMEKGMEKKAVEFVNNRLLQTDFSIAKIAKLAGVTEAFVIKAKTDLK